jgi:hypothetical protein
VIKKVQNTRLFAHPGNKEKSHMRKLLIFGILVGAVAIVIVMSSMRPQPPRKERVELDPLVEVMVLEAMTEQFEVRSQGTVMPRTETVLSAEVSGTVTWISPKFVAGGVFDKGEVLLRIDPTNYDVRGAGLGRGGARKGAPQSRADAHSAALRGHRPVQGDGPRAVCQSGHPPGRHIRN